MLQQQSLDFQLVRQMPPTTHHQLFEGISSLTRNYYFSNSGELNTFLHIDRSSKMPHKKFTSLTKEERKNLPHSKNRFINLEGHQQLVIRCYKIWSSGIQDENPW